MTDKLSKNNIVYLTGKVLTQSAFSHELYGEKFYTVDIAVSRLSESEDRLPLIVSERVVDIEKLVPGQYIDLKGEYRSCNRRIHFENHLLLTLFAREVKLIERQTVSLPNNIYIEGYICKPPFFRKTPLGRQIADVMIAVNRSYAKTDYIPCILWGKNARQVMRMPVGSKVKAWGRIQSREYKKRVDDDTLLRKTAYEVSVNKFERCKERNLLPACKNVAE